MNLNLIAGACTVAPFIQVVKSTHLEVGDTGFSGDSIDEGCNY